MTTFAEIQDGELFVRSGLIFMKTPPINTSIGPCDACGVDMNAVAIGRQDARPLTDPWGLPMLPWYVHFCPNEGVERFSFSAWEVNARRWLEKLNTIDAHNAR